MKKFILAALSAIGAALPAQPVSPLDLNQGVFENSPAGDILAAFPTVCAVGNEYQIMIPVRKESLMRIDVGGESFYDESNGIMRSACTVHRITVPQAKLDAARAYTVCCRAVRKRKAYFTETGDEMKLEISFRPLRPDARRIRLYHLADAHSWIEAPTKAASYWGKDLDLLVMNGDMVQDCRNPEYIAAPYQISGAVTKGEIPVLYARGNHDLRGVLAEKYAEMTPSMHGKTYYSFRLGPLWGIVLDCGEDKTDDHPAYGNTVCCHPFRLRETEYLKKVAEFPDTEYNGPGVRFRIVLSHVPFPQTEPPPFDIEIPLYTEWCRILKTKIKPDLMLSGHVHRCYVIRPGDQRDHKGTPCPIVVGSHLDRKEKKFMGAAIELTPEKAEVFFTDQNCNVTGHETVSFAKAGRGNEK